MPPCSLERRRESCKKFCRLLGKRKGKLKTYIRGGIREQDVLLPVVGYIFLTLIFKYVSRRRVYQWRGELARETRGEGERNGSFD